jgi:hypothetical protein
MRSIGGKSTLHIADSSAFSVRKGNMIVTHGGVTFSRRLPEFMLAQGEKQNFLRRQPRGGDYLR